MAGTTTSRRREGNDHPTPPGSAERDGARILVVDDDASVRRLLCLGLEPLQPGVILEVADGSEAREVLSKRPIDVVITDVVMPRMDGLELMRWAREHCPEPLWIVLSGLDTFDAAKDALQLGAFDFIAKPPTLQDVLVSVRNALEKLTLDRERHRLHRDLERSNSALARQVDDLDHLCRMLEDQSDVIHADLARAEVIQRALLPQGPPKLDGWCVETLYRPGSNVGGDFFDFAVVGGAHLGLVIADAAGHGVAAAMLSVLFKHRLRFSDEDAGMPLAPAEVLHRVNARLHDDLTGPGDFITAVYGLLDLQSGQLRIASAGHPPCLWIEASGAVRELCRTGPALGLQADARYGEISVRVGAGDRLLLYTDGVLDVDGPTPTPVDLIDVIGHSVAGRRALLEDLYDRATSHAAHDPDDVTMILLERCAGVSGINDSPRPHERHGHIAPEMTLLYGARERHAYLAVNGRATWMRSQALLDSATEALTDHDVLTIDLGGCEHLDSTFLGTLHEVATRWPVIDLQCVSQRARQLFEELSMRAVIERIRADPEPLPDGLKPLRTVPDRAELHGERVLRAHETLAALSDENQAQFGAVIETLRSELERT